MSSVFVELEANRVSGASQAFGVDERFVFARVVLANKEEAGRMTTLKVFVARQTWREVFVKQSLNQLAEIFVILECHAVWYRHWIDGRLMAVVIAATLLVLVRQK